MVHPRNATNSKNHVDFNYDPPSPAAGGGQQFTLEDYSKMSDKKMYEKIKDLPDAQIRALRNKGYLTDRQLRWASQQARREEGGG